jgi:Ca2+-binding EF-hand superfamily protein
MQGSTPREKSGFFISDVVDDDPHQLEKSIIELRVSAQILLVHRFAQLGDQPLHLIVLVLALLKDLITLHDDPQRGIEDLPLCTGTYCCERRSKMRRVRGENVMKHRKLSLLVGAVLATGSALAGDGASSVDAQFKMMDANADGKITASEHATGAKSMFTKMDADKDGKITAGEMDASHGAMKDKSKTGEGDDSQHAREMSSEQKISRIDTDGDGVITASEHASGSQMMFAKMDSNSDGSLSKEECREGHKRMMTSDSE